MTEWLNQCHVGDCREILRRMIEAGVRAQTCVTSPPYWGLRDYGIEPSAWGVDTACAHEWGDELRVHKGGPHGDGVMLEGGRSVIEAQAACKDRKAGQFCRRCGAWLGCLGLEPDYRMYIEHMVEVFELVRQVLADDGTLWLNLGDSYATGAGAVGDHPGGGAQGARWRGSGLPKANGRGEEQPRRKGSNRAQRRGYGPMTQPNRMPQVGLKPKDLCLMPARVAISLQEAGWWVRSDIIWHKPNPMPESCTDRPTKAHEYLFLLARAERYYCDMDAIKEPVEADTLARYERGRSDTHKWADGGPYEHGQTIAKGFEHMRADIEDDPRQIKIPSGWDTGPGHHEAFHREGREKPSRKLGPKIEGERDDLRTGRSLGGAHMGRGAGWRDDPATTPENRNKRSVWSIATEAFAEAHFATFPRALIEPCILAGAPPGGVVLDPFMGSGTVAQVAEHLGRQWIGCELNPAYLPMISKRLQQRALPL